MKNALISPELNKLLSSIMWNSQSFYFNVDNGDYAYMPLLDRNYNPLGIKVMILLSGIGDIYDPKYSGNTAGSKNPYLYTLELDVTSVAVTAKSPQYCEVSVVLTSRVGQLMLCVPLVRENRNRRWLLPKQWDAYAEKYMPFNQTQANGL